MRRPSESLAALIRRKRGAARLLWFSRLERMAQMGEAAEAIDWQSETVITEVINVLSDRLGPWLEERGLSARLPSDTLHTHIKSALDFTGERADGYVMARFLEDKRYWPADQYLVAILQETATYRDRAIRKANLPQIPVPGEDGYYPVGTRFKYGDELYEITHIVKNRGVYNLKRVSDGYAVITYQKSLIEHLAKGTAEILPRDNDTF